MTDNDFGLQLTDDMQDMLDGVLEYSSTTVSPSAQVNTPTPTTSVSNAPSTAPELLVSSTIVPHRQSYCPPTVSQNTNDSSNHTSLPTGSAENMTYGSSPRLISHKRQLSCSYSTDDPLANHEGDLLDYMSDSICKDNPVKKISLSSSYDEENDSRIASNLLAGNCSLETFLMTNSSKCNNPSTDISSVNINMSNLDMHTIMLDGSEEPSLCLDKKMCEDFQLDFESIDALPTSATQSSVHDSLIPLSWETGSQCLESLPFQSKNIPKNESSSPPNCESSKIVTRCQTEFKPFMTIKSQVRQFINYKCAYEE